MSSQITKAVDDCKKQIEEQINQVYLTGYFIAFIVVAVIVYIAYCFIGGHDINYMIVGVGAGVAALTAGYLYFVKRGEIMDLMQECQRLTFDTATNEVVQGVQLAEAVGNQAQNQLQNQDLFKPIQIGLNDANATDLR